MLFVFLTSLSLVCFPCRSTKLKEETQLEFNTLVAVVAPLGKIDQEWFDIQLKDIHQANYIPDSFRQK